MNALFNKGAHPRPSLFEESSVHLKMSKTIGKPKKPKQPKRSRQKLSKTIEKTKNKKQQQNCQTHVGQSGHGSESVDVFVCGWFSQWLLIVFALTSLVVLVSLVFPMVFDVFKLLHCMFKRVPGNN